MGSKMRIGLIYGGKSGEHEVSLLTAHAVLNAFDFTKYELQPFYITKKGEWRKGGLLQGPVDDISLLTWEDRKAEALPSIETGIVPIVESDPDPNEDGRAIDIVFPLLHGTYGEDGTIQGMLEMLNIPYVGAGVLASAIGMDKVYMKKIFAHEGLPQCLYRYFNRKQWEKDQAYFIMEIEISLGYPCFIKPANLGSSVGISMASNREQLIEAVELAFRYDRKVIVEERVDGREIEVSVLGNDDPQVSVPGEIVTKNEFYDYEAKYKDGNSEMIIPAPISDAMTKQLQELALRAFQAIDGSGLARVDFFLRDSDQQLLINEINTMPGFTPYSMYPLLWKHSGKPYSELLDDLIQLALKRYNEKQGLEYEREHGG